MEDIFKESHWVGSLASKEKKQYAKETLIYRLIDSNGISNREGYVTPKSLVIAFIVCYICAL